MKVIKDLEFVQTVIFAIHYSDNFAENASEISIKDILKVDYHYSYFFVPIKEQKARTKQLESELGGHGHELNGHRCPCPRHGVHVHAKDTRRAFFST